MSRYKFVRYDHRKHLDAVFDIMTSADEQPLFLMHSISNSLKDFDSWIQDHLKYNYNDFFIVEDENEKLIGIVYSYDHRMIDGHCKITVYIAQEWRHSGIGGLISLDFIGFLFKHYPYRRINCDVYSYNLESQTSLRQAGFEETGRVKEYRYLNGRYHDLLLFTISRDCFVKKWASRFAPELTDEQ